MVDYSVDDSFDIHFEDEESIAEVDGREEFEEDIIIQLDSRLGELTGGYKDRSTIEEKVELLASRAAREFDLIDRINRIVAYEPIDKPETISLEIEYISGATFEESL